METPDNIPHALERTNPNFNTGAWKWTNNCQRCVIAYEMRRRGYDVEALPALGKKRYDEMMYMHGPRSFPKAFEGRGMSPVTGDDGAAERKAIEARMEAYGDGARALIRVGWTGRDYGHVFCAERRGAETWFVDPQSNGIAYEGWESSIDPSETFMMRVDDLSLTDVALLASKNRS